MKEMGIPVPTNILIESSTLQNKKELIDAISAQEQQQSKMAEDQAMAQIEVLKAQIKDLESKALANEGLGVERASRVQENRALAVERYAAAQKDRDLGVLDRIKAAKEITGIDLDHLQRAVNIIKALQEKEETVEEKNSKILEQNDIKKI
jgi:hypothetical protein